MPQTTHACRELGTAVLGVRPGVWFYLGPRLGSFKTTQCNYSDHKMYCESPTVPDATGKGDAGSGPAPAKASPLGLSAVISLPTQLLRVKVSLTPYISARPEDSSPITTYFFPLEVCS